MIYVLILVGLWLLVMGVLLYIRYWELKQHWLDARKVLKMIRERGRIR